MTEPIFTILVLIFIIITIMLIIIGALLLYSDEGMTDTNLQIVIGILVTIMWAASIIAEIAIADYTVHVLIHGIMGALVGYLFSEDGITFNIGGN